jgi:hypothetical protein
LNEHCTDLVAFIHILARDEAGTDLTISFEDQMLQYVRSYSSQSDLDDTKPEVSPTKITFDFSFLFLIFNSYPIFVYYYYQFIRKYVLICVLDPIGFIIFELPDSIRSYHNSSNKIRILHLLCLNCIIPKKIFKVTKLAISQILNNTTVLILKLFYNYRTSANSSNLSAYGYFSNL